MSTKELPPVHDCAVEGCSYNSDTQCHAGATSITGGLPTETAMVGACHRADCTHNDHLECHADSIRVGPGADPADCLTYEVA